VLSAVSNGAGVSVVAPLDNAVNHAYCNYNSSGPVPQFRSWNPYTTVAIRNSVVRGNRADCAGCSGGGIAMLSGGVLVIANSTLANNHATGFGGGLLLGDSSSGVSSCALVVENSLVAGNVANRGGNQIYDTGGGNVTLINTTVRMTSNSEVRVLGLSVCRKSVL
jgi:hypothetical protein